MKSRLVVGLMSGTSVDGVDAALVEINEEKTNLIAFESTPYKTNIRNAIFELFDKEKATVDKIGKMNFLLGEIYAECVISLLRCAGIQAKDVALIGSHGQTIYHSPVPENYMGYSIAYTVQIGEAAVIAQRTGIPCVSDFRVADIAAGGNGAPLVPFTDFILYRSMTENTALLNIGGIANVTVIPSGCEAEKVFAFDTGPGNMISDAFVSAYTSGAMQYDRDGAIALAGTVNNEMLRYMLNDEYFFAKPPKTTGRERYGVQYANMLMKRFDININDATATAAYFTALTVANAYNDYIAPKAQCKKLIASGGGVHNNAIMLALKCEMQRYGVEVKTQEELGFSSDAKEAVAFALLADFTVNGKPNNLPAATGAKCSAIMGKLQL